MNTEDKENLFRVQFTKETNHILHDYDTHGMYEKGFHAKYVEWLEAKLKNLGEGEAGTGYALLSDVRLLVDTINALIIDIGKCTCSKDYTDRALVDPSCQYHEYLLYIIDIQNAFDKVKAHFR